MQSRQEEINHFQPEKYHTLSIKVDGYDFQLDSNKRYKNKEDLEALAQQVKKQEGKILDIKTKHKKMYPQMLYNLTDLQQDVSTF